MMQFYKEKYDQLISFKKPVASYKAIRNIRTNINHL